MLWGKGTELKETIWRRKKGMKYTQPKPKRDLWELEKAMVRVSFSEPRCHSYCSGKLR